MLTLRRPWITQPRLGGVDWGNSLTRGLLRLYDFSRSGIDATGFGVKRWTVGTGGLMPTTFGSGLHVNQASTVGSGESTATLLSSGMSAILVAVKHANPGGTDLLFGDIASYAYNWGFVSGVDNFLGFAVTNSTGTAKNATGGDFPISSIPVVAVGTYGDGDNYVRNYTNGVLKDSNPQTGTIQQNAYSIGCNYWSGSSLDVTVLLGGVWNRCLTPDEVWRVSRNPWQLFAPMPQQIWVPSISTAPTLSSPTMVNITTTTATPRVTVTF
jgi:hypothetical protein